MIDAIDPAAVTEQQKSDLIQLKQRLDTTEISAWTIVQIRSSGRAAETTAGRPALADPEIQRQPVRGFRTESGIAAEKSGTEGIPDTYKLTLKETVPEAEVQVQVKTIASGNGAEIEQWFSVSGQKNYDKTLTLRTPLCVTMSLPEGWNSSKKVTVWRLEAGDVIQMPTDPERFDADLLDGSLRSVCARQPSDG